MDGTHRQPTGEYQVRPYQPGDRAGFLSLYERVWGRPKSTDWFEWRFGANPYRDGIRMIVADSGDGLVGAEPLLPFRLQVDGTEWEAYQPVDWIVHPDHRRRGLFTRMTETLLDDYLPEVSLLFNFPNSQLRPGLEKHNWEVVGPVVCRYRIQNTRRFTDRANVKELPAAIALATKHGTPLIRAGLGALDRITATAADVTVERHAELPVETVHELYRSARPERIHVPRDRPFLRWRFANPNWETRTYVAAHEEAAVASIITATEETPSCRVTHLLDIQPVTDRIARPAAVDALLSAVVDDATDADLLRAPTNCYPRVFRRHGFYRDDTFPLSVVATTTTHAIRLPDPTVASASLPTDRLTDPDSWRLTVGDLDIE
ncbi:GNAT family N-acetyltransferase [Halohasta litorea]|uniref:GNAT family N-acetyltransferase n=1 Tax=Halohasta litorea TaxID=869891 RepID=A0ABD6DBZ3_9EURY|nr:GNAT family N-acetyltransferase [Halohasta litorea]MEA1930241.1 GNAT family N-acetyltransferase [Euryarchaeota archaeon]